MPLDTGYITNAWTLNPTINWEDITRFRDIHDTTVTGQNEETVGQVTTTIGRAQDTFTTDNFDLNEFKFEMPNYRPTFVTTEDLDKFAKRIYKIITEHTRIDITEEEYMRLLHEEG